MKLHKLLKLIRYIYFFNRAIWAKDSGEFLSAYKFISKAERVSGRDNAKLHLFRAYICILNDQPEEGLESIMAFCNAYFLNTSYLKAARLNAHERAWLEVFGEYVLCTLTGKRFEELGYDGEFSAEHILSIDFGKVDAHYKRLFPPTLHGRALKVLEKESEVES